MLSLELLKMKRRQFFLPIIIFAGVGLFWCTVIAIKEFNVNNDNRTISVLINDLVIVNSMVYPLLIGVLCSRLIEIEHIGKTFRLLQTSNQNIQKLFYAKNLIAISIIIVLGVIQGIYLFFTSNLAGLRFDLGIIGGFFISYFVSSIFLIDFHLAISLFIEKQSIGIILALGGSFIALVSGGMLPKSIQLLIPWQYYALSNPIKREVLNNEYLYSKNPIYLFSVVVILLLFIVELLIIRKRLEEMEFC